MYGCVHILYNFNQSITRRLPLNQPLHFFFQPDLLTLIWSDFFPLQIFLYSIPFCHIVLIFYILFFFPSILPCSFYFLLFIHFLHPHPRIHSSAFLILSMKHFQCCFYVQYMKTNQQTPILNLYLILSLISTIYH